MLSSRSKRPFPGSQSATPDAAQPEATSAKGSSISLKKKARKTFSEKQDETVIDAIAAAIPSIEDDLLRLKDYRLEEPDDPLYIPLQAKPSLQSPDDTLFPLMGKALEFLAGPGQVFLLLGDSGGGKSTFNLQLERALWKTYKRGDPIPLHINLPSIDNPQQDIIGKQLRQLDFSDTQIMELKQSRELIVICDGYDESQLTTNLHTTNAFNQPGQWSAKMFVFCRTQYLGSDYHNRFAPQGSGAYDRPALDLFQEAVIAPFTKEQIQRYIDIFVPLESRPWLTEDYMRILTMVPNLMELVKNPFLLTLALETLPAITDGKLNLSAIKISRVQLYDAFTVHWLSVNKRRLESNALSDHDRAIFDQLLDAGFISMGIQYSMRLASAIFEHQNGGPVIQYVSHSDRSSWKAEFFGNDPMMRLMLESSPLTRSGNYFQFVHRSMLEYFFSCVIYNPPNPDGIFDTQADPASSVAPSIVTNGLLFRRNLIQETSIILFLCDRVKSNPDLEEQLRGIVDLSKTDTNAIIAATNAITILVRAGVHLNGADLRGVKIPGADLSGGQFDSTQFQGSDLKDVNLTRSWLRQADLSGARLAGVRFGQLPYLDVYGYVSSCSYSPDGRMLAVALRYQGFDIYATSTWKVIHQFITAEEVQDIEFSPNNQQIVWAGEMGSVRTWDCTSGEEVLSMSGHTKDVRSVAFSPCGKQIASAGDGGIVRLWNSQTGDSMFVLEGHTEGVSSVKYSPDGRWLVSGGEDGTIRVWNPQTSEAGVVLSPSLGEVCSLAYSPDGRWVASGHDKGALQLWYAVTSESGPLFSGHSDTITRIAFSPSGQWIASSSDDDTVKLWDTYSGTLLSVWADHCTFVKSVAFSPDGLQIASGGHDAKVRLWDVSSILSSLDPRDGDLVDQIAYAPDGRTILAQASCRVLQKWNATTATSFESIPLEIAEPQAVSCMAFTREGSQFAVGYENGSIHLCNRQTASSVLEGHSGKVGMLVYSPCCTWIASVDENSIVRLWNLHNAEQHRSLVEVDGNSERSVCVLMFSPTGGRLAIGTLEGFVSLFDLLSMKPVTCINLTGGILVSMAYAPNDQQIAIGDMDGCIYLWDLQSEDPSIKLESHVSWVLCIAYSPCGQWIASGCDFDAVEIWHRQLSGEVESWSNVYSICSFFAAVHNVAWNPVVPMELVTGCRDGSVRVWRVSHDEDGKVVVKMLWGSNLGILLADSLVLKNTIDLSPVNQELLLHLGASIENVIIENR